MHNSSEYTIVCDGQFWLYLSSANNLDFAYSLLNTKYSDLPAWFRMQVNQTARIAVLWLSMNVFEEHDLTIYKQETTNWGK